nr:O-antigen ligase family protein [Zoogloeaceae bacterium]
MSPLCDRARALRTQATTRFITSGWLMPAYFPLALIVGRGVFNSALALYIVWALAAAPALRQHGHRTFLLLLVALLSAYLASVTVALDPARALKLWATVVVYVSIAPITLSILAMHPDKLARLQHTLGLGAVLALLVAYVDLAVVRLNTDHFIPRLDLRAVDLAFCLPFMLAWLWRTLGEAWRVAGVGTALLALAGFVVLSDERGVLMGVLMACMVMGLLVLRLRLWQVLIVGGGLIGFALFTNGDSMLRGLSGGDELFGQLDALSSSRLTLWSQALANPPANPLFGVGMGNAQYYPAVVNLGEITVRHLHNLWLDAWYETGMLGLGLLISLIGYVFARSAASWRRMTP